MTGRRFEIADAPRRGREQWPLNPLDHRAGRVRPVRLPRGTRKGPGPGGTGEVEDLAYSPDGSLPAVAGADGVRVRDPRPHTDRGRLTVHTDTVPCVAFSRDGTAIATGGRDGTARPWDIPRRAPRATPRGHTGRVQGAVSDGDDTLHAVSRGGTRRTWDLEPHRVAVHACERIPPPSRACRDGC